jgi:hypothetical protein
MAANRERERLAEEERTASERLAALRTAIDETTEQLLQMAAERHLRRESGPGLSRTIRDLSDTLKAQLLNGRSSYALNPNAPSEMSRVLDEVAVRYIRDEQKPRCKACGQMLPG